MPRDEVTLVVDPRHGDMAAYRSSEQTVSLRYGEPTDVTIRLERK